VGCGQFLLSASKLNECCGLLVLEFDVFPVEMKILFSQMAEVDGTCADCKMDAVKRRVSLVCFIII
jgi:hypothetical protein